MDVLQIPQGKLRGRERRNLENKKFYSFQGIPYALPPVGKRRFMPPIPHEGWCGILNATRDCPICYQQKHIGQEDCLYLNVYTKNVLDMASVELKPVMVYIFGGAFVEGHPREELYGPDYLMTADIVLVVMNYRVGALGFCNIRKSCCGFVTANAGLKDQVMALRWVQENISHFGGNPTRVTLFGHSAGGGSVGIHILSPLSAGLFQRAIAQSGSAMCPWAVGKPGFGEKLAHALNITACSGETLLARLQEVPVNQLIDAQADVINLRYSEQQYNWPVIEGPGQGNFYTDHPIKLLESGRFNKVRLMTGFTSFEGLLVHVGPGKDAFSFIFDVDNLIPYRIKSQYRTEVRQLIKDFYFAGRDPTCADTVAVLQAVSDCWFAFGVYQTARFHARYNDVYLYKFSADTILNFFKRMDPVTAAMPGASHVDELGYLFKGDYSPKIEVPSDEYTWIKHVVSLWTNFAINDSPDILEHPRWLKVDPCQCQTNYLDIDTTLSQQVDPFKERFDFWTYLYDNYS